MCIIWYQLFSSKISCLPTKRYFRFQFKKSTKNNSYKIIESRLENFTNTNVLPTLWSHKIEIGKYACKYPSLCGVGRKLIIVGGWATLIRNIDPPPGSDSYVATHTHLIHLSNLVNKQSFTKTTISFASQEVEDNLLFGKNSVFFHLKVK